MGNHVEGYNSIKFLALVYITGRATNLSESVFSLRMVDNLLKSCWSIYISRFNGTSSEHPVGITSAEIL